MRYAHAKPGERCDKCNDLATRIVARQALCIVHFDALVGTITRTARRRYLTPPLVESSYARIDDWKHWAQLLAEAVEWGVITEAEADEAWRNGRKGVA